MKEVINILLQIFYALIGKKDKSEVQSQSNAGWMNIVNDTLYVADGPTVEVRPDYPYSITQITNICESVFGPLNRIQKKSVCMIRMALSIDFIIDPAKVAYILATAWHESKLCPVKERRAKKGSKIRALQDRYWNTGYYGRGYVQLTHKENYTKFSKLLNIDIVNNPNLALREDIAANILVTGMKKGLFTGKKLKDFFSCNPDFNWVGARRIVNGLDKAALIAGYAIDIYEHLKREL